MILERSVRCQLLNSKGDKMIWKFFLLLLCMLPGAVFAGDGQSQLSAFVSYTDLRMSSVERSLEIVAATGEAKSGKWEDVKGLLQGYQRSEDGLILWYLLPDGRYYTLDKGLMDVKLSDRNYFPDLMAGRNIVGALVISKSTGNRSAVIAVPVMQGDKVVGAIGASLFLDRLSEQVGSMLSLGDGASFFALAPDGLTVLHSKTDRHFLDTRELGSASLKQAATAMLSRDSGTVVYEYDRMAKRAIFRTSSLTQWKFAISRSSARH